ncbi:hypothetical protein ACH5RR_039418 [Cinchona calisaya]|uniref:Chorismate mutase n=1 Tax=Cinchona calisaya TaxID=153742 RepID=A0ABD2Y293_9GENT
MAGSDPFSLESIRNSLIRQEDTIIFSLIERAKYPLNPQLYDSRCSIFPGIAGSLLENFVKETEAIQAKFGRYQSPEENPFFPDNLPDSLVPPQSHPQVLHPGAASININKTIWDIYINKLLPLFASEGHDENYMCISACDLECLQALSRRIHYGKFVAEVKFKDAPEEYSPAIHAKDRDALMKLLTFESVEEMVKKRVEKKAKVFGQEVTLNNDDCNGKFKIDPSVLPRLYGEWVMPLTKHVEVEYLLRRLD